jgi:hypothetical protein
MRTAHSLRQRLALIASDEDCTRLRWCCRGRREDPAPIAAVEEVLDRLALRLKAKPSAALPCRGNPQIRDKFALSRRTLRALRHNQRRLASGAPICSGRRLTAIALLIQARTYHFTLHSVIERDRSFLYLRSKCSTKLLFQAAYQRVAKRSEMKWLRPKSSVLATRMANDRLEHFALIERTNDGSDRVHQFKVLSFHIAMKQALRIRSEFKKSAVKIGQQAFDGWATSSQTIV